MGVFGDDSDQGILRPAIIKCGQNCRFMDYGSPKMEEQNNYYDRENINYDEYDEDYNDEPSCIPENALKPVAGGKFEYIQEVPYVLHGVLNGFQGKNIKRIQTDCNVKVFLPNRNSKSDDVKIIGSRQGIDKASTQIELLVDGKRFNRSMTHFLTFRLSKSEGIMEKFQEWKEEVLGKFPFDERLFQSPSKLHLTIGVLHLLSQKEVKRVQELLNGRVQETINSLLSDLELQEVKLNMEGIEIMNDDPYMTDVVYAKISDPDEVLQNISEEIMNIFKEEELAEAKYNRVKIHCTVMNSKFVRKAEEKLGKKNDRTRHTYDASQMVRDYENYDFGKIVIDEVLFHENAENNKAPDGYYKTIDSVKF